MDSIGFLSKKIPAVFSDGFPKNNENSVKYFGFFSKQEIERNRGKLLMLDLDFGARRSFNCQYCFRRNNLVDRQDRKPLSFDELLQVIKDAKKLGLQTVKFCGAGEPFENEHILPLLEELTKLDVGACIFTKGNVLGDDALAKKFFSANGISSAKELCERLFGLKTSVVVGFTFPIHALQDSTVGSLGYSKKRDIALINLIEAGFNKTNPTRLVLGINPVLKENYSSVFESYVFARERNIYPLVSFLMTSGKSRDKALIRKIDLTEKQKLDLFEKIYSYNIEKGIQTLGQLKSDGISCMPGGHPCNQVACGMYLTLNGTVLVCPGDEETIFGNVRDAPLKEIWGRSENFKRKGTFNCRCPPKDGKTIPVKLYQDVLKMLEQKYAA